MNDNAKFMKQRCEKVMDEFTPRFTFNERSPVQKTYYNSIKNKKSCLFKKTAMKRIHLL